jgi:hypothetical protein
MSRLVDFYRGQRPDIRGRYLRDIWSWDDDQLEEVHDFIQWLFPLPDPSQFNPSAPRLTDEDVAAFQGDPALRANLLKSFERILTFLGLALTGEGQVVEGPNFAARQGDVWAGPNHNWLRITRILSSLRTLGLGGQSRALYERLNQFYSGRRFAISADTFQYWTEAVEGLPFHA